MTPVIGMLLFLFVDILKVRKNDKLQDLAKFIIWLRGYFPAEKEVILCNEDYSASLVLIGDVSVNDIKKRLE